MGSSERGNRRAAPKAVTGTTTLLLGPGLASTLTHILTHRNIEVAVCNRSAEILNKVGQLRPDVMLLPADVEGSLVTLRDLRARAYATKTLIVTACCDHQFIATILRHGASGCVRPTSSPAYLVKAILAVKRGDIWLERNILARALGDLVREIDLRRQPESNPDYSQNPLVLTDREKEIVRLLAKGLTNKEIAEKLSVSKETVKMHLKHIFDKLGVHRRAQVVLHQLCQRLIVS